MGRSPPPELLHARHNARRARTPPDPHASHAALDQSPIRSQSLVQLRVRHVLLENQAAISKKEIKRNVATVEPLSKLLELPINLYDKNDYESVLETILDNHKGKIILVVGHSDTLANLMAELGASKSVPTIADNEYDNIYIVSIPWFGKTKTIRLRYGAPYDPDGKVRAIK